MMKWFTYYFQNNCREFSTRDREFVREVSNSADVSSLKSKSVCVLYFPSFVLFLLFVMAGVMLHDF